MEVSSPESLEGKAPRVQAEPRPDGLNFVRASHLLFMLIHAQRHRGVTIKSVGEAAEPPVAGPNLSVFIKSSGESRNVKAERLEQMLLMLGVLRDGLLTPGLHRWDITRHTDESTSRGVPRREVDTLIDLLDENSKGMDKPQCVCLTWSGGKPDDAVAFVLLRPTPITSLIARIDRSEVEALGIALGERFVVRHVTDGEGAELQSVWHLNDHEWIVGRKIEQFLKSTEATSVSPAIASEGANL